ncbi:hypothetical protein [Frigoribacterium salinisoli]
MTTTTAPTPTLTDSSSAPASSGTSSPLSLSSLVLGLASIVTGSLFLVPIAGLVLALMARTREPESRSTWIIGLLLNAIMLGIAVGGVLLVGVGMAFLGLGRALS